MQGCIFLQENTTWLWSRQSFKERISKEMTCVSWWHLFSQLFQWRTSGIKQSPAHAYAGVYILAGKHNVAVIQAVFQRKNLKRNDTCLMETFVFSTISMTVQWVQAKPSSCQCRGVYSSRKTQRGCDPGRISKELTCVLWWHLFSQLFHWQTRGNKHKIFFSFQVPEILWHTIQCVSHIFGFNVSSWKGHVFRRKEK